MASESSELEANETSDDADGDLRAKVAKEGGIAFGAGLFNKAIGIAFQILLARFLGPSGYGLYVLGWTVVNYFQPFVLLGLLDGLVRFVPDYLSADDHDLIRGTIYSSFGIALTLALLVAAGIYSSAEVLAVQVFNKQNFTPILRAFALTLPIFVLMHVTTAIAVGFKQVRYQQSIKNVLFPLLKISIIGTAFLAGFRLLGAVYGLLLALILTATVGGLLLPRILSNVSIVGSVDVELGRLIRYSVPLFLVGFSELAINQTDRLLLGVLGSSTQVGLYNAAYVLSQQTLIFFTAIMTIFNPVVADLHSQDKYDELQAVYKTVTRWILIVSLPTVVFGSTFAPELLTVFNEQFAGGSPLLLLLLVAQLVFVSVGPAREVLVMSDQQDLVLIDTLALLAVNIGLNILLIPEYGASGAAIATVLTIGIVQFIQVYQADKHVGVFPFDATYLRVVAIGVPFASLGYVAWYFSTSFLLRIGLAVVMGAYYALMIWTFAITEEDIQMLKDAI